MVEATQSAQIVSSTVAGIDLRSFFGLSGVPIVESFVNYLRDQWKVPKTLLPLTSVGGGIGLNALIASYLGTDLHSALIVGALVGLLASGWHEVTK